MSWVATMIQKSQPRRGADTAPSQVETIVAKFLNGPAAASQIESSVAEFLRVPAAAQFSGLSRSHIYELVKSGEIRSSCIRRRGALRGVRLIHRDSLTNFILSNSAEK